jgi:GTP pyrophosphokinase
MKNLPFGASALDFAFAVHSEIGIHCIGAKVNNKLVPLSSVLKSGDQIEILTSKNQKPKEDWLNFVKTHRAKSKIKSALKEEKRELAIIGKAMLEKEFKRLEISHQNISLKELKKHFKAASSLDLYFKIATEEIKLNQLRDFEVKHGLLRLKRTIPTRLKKYFERKKTTKTEKKEEILVIGDNMEKLDYSLAQCCNPIPGDEVFGFITVAEGIKIHKVSCPNAVQLMSNYAYRVIKARWIEKDKMDFLTGLKIIGIDNVGIVNNITQVVSNELHVNMRSIKFESYDGIFEGTIMVFVQNTSHLENLIKNLKKVAGVTKIERIDN